MDDKLSETINNICTVLGGALLLYPLIDKAAKTVIPEMQKLAAGETEQVMKLLPSPEQEEQKEPDKENKEERRRYTDDRQNDC